MTTYLALRELHRTAVILSLTLFALRGLWMLADSPQLRRRWVRIVPHLIDTVLLASAIGLTLILQQYPFVNGWLTAKLFGLLTYIVLGAMALRRGRTREIRIRYFRLALLAYAYIVSVALTRNPFIFL